jgi:hypothetical protein
MISEGCQYDGNLKCLQDGCADCRVLAKYFKRKCNNCHNYASDINTIIKGCHNLPNKKSPKKYYCSDWKEREVKP